VKKYKNFFLNIFAFLFANEVRYLTNVFARYDGSPILNLNG
jgi:hypothetical protein